MKRGKKKKKAVSHTEVTLFPSPNLLLAEEKKDCKRQNHRKKKQIRKGRKKKEGKKKHSHSLTLSILILIKKILFLVDLLINSCWQ